MLSLVSQSLSLNAPLRPTPVRAAHATRRTPHLDHA